MLPLQEKDLNNIAIVPVETIKKGNKFLRLINNYPVVLEVLILEISDNTTIINRQYNYASETPVIIFK